MAHQYTVIDQKTGKPVTRTKKSGAKHSKYFPTKGDNKGIEQHIVNGWQIVKGDLIKWTCQTTRKTNSGKKKDSPNSKNWLSSVRCERFNTVTCDSKIFWGIMNKNTGTVIMSDIGYTLKPTANNGGYCGRITNKGKF